MIIDPVKMRQFCQSRGQVAFILAHEMTHLIRHDPEETEKNDGALFATWYTANASRYPEGTPDEEVIEAWMKADEAKRAAFQKPREDLADMDAAQWIRTLKDPVTDLPFEKTAGADALAAAKEWLRALGEQDVDPSHGSLRERVAALRKQGRMMAPEEPAKAR